MLSDYVILGVISLYPCSGYDIKTELDSGGAGLFSGLNFGTIYPRLKALEQQALIETYQASPDGRNKKLYELTAAGWRDLAAWLALPPEFPIPMRDELLLKMIFWGATLPDDRATLIDHLQLRRDQSVALRDYLTAWPTNGVSSISEYGMLVLTLLRARLDVELTWIDATIRQLEQPPQPPAQDPYGLIPRQTERRVAALAASSANAGDQERDRTAQ